MAYSILSDPEKRRVYDETGSSQVANGYRADIEKAFAMMFLEHLNRSMAEADSRAMSLSDLMNKVANRTADPLVSLRQMVDQNLETLKAQIKDIGKQIQKLERAATKLKFKGAATEKNVLALAIKGAIMNAEAQKLGAERQIAFLSDIRVEADKYECSLVDPPVQQGPQPGGKPASHRISFARQMHETSGPWTSVSATDWGT
jgi:ElaB/YqjD/DUF883 family membrane-anchored ribosome-binding protein